MRAVALTLLVSGCFTSAGVGVGGIAGAGTGELVEGKKGEVPGLVTGMAIGGLIGVVLDVYLIRSLRKSGFGWH